MLLSLEAKATFKQYLHHSSTMNNKAVTMMNSLSWISSMLSSLSDGVRSLTLRRVRTLDFSARLYHNKHCTLEYCHSSLILTQHKHYRYHLTALYLKQLQTFHPKASRSTSTKQNLGKNS